MKGSQGEFYWRSAFVNLEKLGKVYQIRFVHKLPESDCDLDGPCTTCKRRQCSASNVAISGIRLDCQGISQTYAYEVCNKREVPLSGCEIFADKPVDTGKLALITTNVFRMDKSIHSLELINPQNCLFPSP